MAAIYLASSSPRRRQLLEQIGLPFTVIKTDVDESVAPDLSPSEQVQLLSRRKAQWGAESNPQLNGIIIGADTIVVLDEQVLGKPNNSEQAYLMLQQLMGKTHRVLTGITLLDWPSGHVLSDCEETLVQMRTASKQELWRYIATNEPLDKAGSYGAQGMAAIFVTSVKGCYYNVVGLPLAKLTLMLSKMDVDVSAYWR